MIERLLCPIPITYGTGLSCILVKKKRSSKITNISGLFWLHLLFHVRKFGRKGRGWPLTYMYCTSHRSLRSQIPVNYELEGICSSVHHVCSYVCLMCESLQAL